jgi:hypothetical protein
MAMVPIEIQEQGKTKGTKKVVIDVDEKDTEKVDRKEMAVWSETWKHFIRIKDDKGCLKAARCKYCHREIKADVTEPTNYTRLSKKIIYRADNLANLSPYCNGTVQIIRAQV